MDEKQIVSQKDNEELLALLQKQSDLINSMQRKETPDPEKEAMTIDLKEVALLLLRRAWIILLCMILCAGAMLAYSVASYTPSYTATVKLYVNNSNDTSETEKTTTSDLSASKALAETYSVILDTYNVYGKVGEKLKEQGYTGYGYDKLHKMVSSGPVNDTGVFGVTVTDSDDARAIAIANTIKDVLPTEISTIIEGTSVSLVDDCNEAVLKSNGFAKKALIAALVGFVGACAAIVVLEYLMNDTVKDESWLTDNYPSVPVLGNVPNASGKNAKTGYGKHYGYGYGYYSRKNSYYYYGSGKHHHSNSDKGGNK